MFSRPYATTPASPRPVSRSRRLSTPGAAEAGSVAFGAPSTLLLVLPLSRGADSLQHRITDRTAAHKRTHAGLSEARLAHRRLEQTRRRCGRAAWRWQIPCCGRMPPAGHWPACSCLLQCWCHCAAAEATATEPRHGALAGSPWGRHTWPQRWLGCRAAAVSRGCTKAPWSPPGAL